MKYKENTNECSDTLTQISKEIRNMNNTAHTQSSKDLKDLDAIIALSEEIIGEEIEESVEDQSEIVDEALEEVEEIAAAAVIVDENMDDVLADLDLDAVSDEIEELPEADGVLDDDEMRAIDLAIERQEAYQTQTAAAVVSIEKHIPTPAGKVKNPGKRGSSVPRASRDINTVAPEFFVLSGDVTEMDQAALDAAKIATMALKPTQIKVAEKFENLFLSVAAGKVPSIYTKIAFDLLNANGTITSGDLIAAYKTTLVECCEGTARSQTGQLMNLLAAVGIAKRAGNTLELIKDSVLADRVRKVAP
jgi:hypothetical protein